MILEVAINTSEKDLIELLRSGDEKAIEILFDMHYDYLCKCVYKLIQDAPGCEDIVQEVFTEVWKKREQIKINTSLKGYLRRAAINKALNQIRSRRYTIDEADDAIQIQANISSSQEVMEGNEMQLKLNAAINKLPEKCRIVFSLSRFEELSYKEIAAKLDISTKTVENQISKALKVLKAELHEYYRR